ncbi:MAG: substrate-binding domain-containing protein [Firmicutes bacterium]|nr:substrate-binding domain-containing protein [Bacillota bacterium]
MNKKILAVLLIFVMLFAMAACGGTDDGGDETVTDTVLTMATTTSTDNTGLLDYLQPLFLEDTGYDLQWTAVGTGEAIAMGTNGDVDIILVHAKASEEEFVASGAGVERFPVMYNDFVIVGPEEENAYGDDLKSCLGKINNDQLGFVSRGDDSGTHKAELKLWPAFGLDYTANPNYIEAGQGMGATIAMADEQQAYCLTDRGTWLAQKNNADLTIDLEIVCQGAKNLLNQYGVIAVNPDHFPEIDINNAAANAFIEWICSEDIQAKIADFGVAEYGEPLFFPNAGTDN